MKEFHEIAVIKDDQSNIINGFLLVAQQDIINISKLHFSNVKYASYDDMEELVKEDKVQYFIYDNELGSMSISYTDEEVSEMKKLSGRSAVNFMSKVESLDAYLDNDVIFNSGHYRQLEKNNAVIATLVNVMKIPFVGRLYGVILYGRNDFGIRFGNWYKAQSDIVKKMIVPISIGNEIVVINTSDVIYDRVAREFCALTHVSLTNREKMSGIAGMMKTPLKTFTDVKPDIDALNSFVINTCL